MPISKLFKKFNLSSSKKNVAKISFGTLGGQIVSFITLPIITRIYGAEIIGIWTLFQSYSIIINSFSDLGLTNAIMLSKEDAVMTKIYKVISTIVLGFSALFGIIICFYYRIVGSPNNMSIGFISLYLIIATFTLQQIQICYTWLNKKGKYDVLMKNPIINNISCGIISIFLGVFGFKEYGYFLGWIMGQIFTLLNMKRNLPKSMFSIDKREIKEVLNENSNFLKYQLPTNIISNFKNQLPVLAIKSFFGAEILGYYSLTVKILQIPSTFLANAIGRVFFQTVSDMKLRGEYIGNFVYNNIINVMKIAAIPIIVLFSSGDYLITIFLGSNWDIAGNILRIMTFQTFFMFLMSTVQGLAIILEEQKLAMNFSIIQSIGFVIGLSIGRYIFNNAYIGIALMSFTFVICNIIYFSTLFKKMDIDKNKYLTHVIFYIILIFITSYFLRFLLNFLGIS